MAEAEDTKALRRALIPLDTIESVRNGQWFCGEGGHEGFFFRHDRTHANNIYLKCVKRGCKGRAIVRIHTRQVEYTGQHLEAEIHNPNMQTKDDIILQCEFARKLLRLARETCDPLKKIYDNVAFEFPARITKNIQYLEIRDAMVKTRQRCQPRLPDTIQQLADVLRANDAPDWLRTNEGENFIIRSRNDGIIIISPRTKELLKENITFSVDGTFKVAPKKPKIFQVYIVGGILYGVFIPIAFGLLQSKTADIYEWMFGQIRNITAPHWNPHHIKMDFEAAAITAFKNLFGNHCPLSGCWFHFSQAIQRKCGMLGLIVPMKQNEELRHIIKKLMALALLPAANIEQGFNNISGEAENFILQNLNPYNDIGLINNILELLQYIENYWIGNIGTNMISVFNSDQRTNNLHEAFNSNIGSHISNCVKVTKPNMWRFIDALRKIENDAAIKYLRLRNDPGCNLRYPKNKKWIQQDNRIAESQALLHAGIYTVEQFLNRAKHFFNFHQAEAPEIHHDEIQVLEPDEDDENYIQEMIVEAENNEDQW